MTTPIVTLTEVDGALGITPSTGPKPMAVIGACDAGTADVPLPLGSSSALVTAVTGGPAAEAAAYHIDTQGIPVVLIPTGKSVDGSFPGGTAVTFVGSGTSTITIAAAPLPTDDYEMVMRVVTGGTIGVAGIEIQFSYDGGRNYGGKVALGTATTYTVPNAGEVEFAAGTLVAGDTAAWWTKAPQWNSTELTAAFTALKSYLGAYDVIQVVGDIDATAFAAIKTALDGLDAVGQHHVVIGHFRMPQEGETDATYAAAVGAIAASLEDTRIAVYGSAFEITSTISGRRYRRPPSFEAASLEAASSEEINIADPSLGSLNGTIIDSNNNPKYHDERIDGSLDDLRIACLRTFSELAGTYVNRPILMSAAGSDYELVPHRRVIDLAKRTTALYLTRRLNKPTRVNKTTGFLLEEDAAEIEAGLNAQLSALLGAKPKASGGGFTRGRYAQVSRTDNVISTKTVSVQLRVVPLAYPEVFNVEIGYFNPAIAIVPTS